MLSNGMESDESPIHFQNALTNAEDLTKNY